VLVSLLLVVVLDVRAQQQKANNRPKKRNTETTRTLPGYERGMILGYAVVFGARR